MKKHLLGICVALFFAFASFYVSPIQFTKTANLMIMNFDNGTDCHAYPHMSNHFINVVGDFCDYETAEMAEYRLGTKVSESVEIIEPITSFSTKKGTLYKRAIVRRLYDDKNFFVIIRQNEHWVSTIYSTSLRHVLEFEQQNPH